jgi:hypothetical protein
MFCIIVQNYCFRFLQASITTQSSDLVEKFYYYEHCKQKGTVKGSMILYLIFKRKNLCTFFFVSAFSFSVCPEHRIRLKVGLTRFRATSPYQPRPTGTDSRLLWLSSVNTSKYVLYVCTPI